jgi:protein phosphatase
VAGQTLTIPELSVVVLVGASGAGKSTFARRWFLPTEIVSSDFCRALIADDENDQAATPHAFEVLHTIVAKRLELGKLAVIDATNLYPEDRKRYLELAQAYHAIPVAIALALPASVCLERNATRTDRTLREGVIRRQVEAARQSLRQLEREGFRHVYVLRTPEEVESATIVRIPLRPNMHRADTGPFDIIGDVHGCLDELLELLRVLGWQVEGDCPTHPDGRKAVFVGDLIDRGPNSVGVVQLVQRMVEVGVAYAVIGNHDEKLIRYLRGRRVQVSHGLERTLQELEAHPESLRDAAARFPGEPTQPLGAGQRQAGGGARRHQASLHRTVVARNPRLLLVRRDDRRERRVRAARALELGGGLPRQRAGRLRAHAEPRPAVAEQHGEHRHGVRLRRRADRPALP